MKKATKAPCVCRLAAALLAAALLLAGCGGGGSAGNSSGNSDGASDGASAGASGGAADATMHLRSLVGEVKICDADEKEIGPEKGLELYSGYTLFTRTDSFSWIDLDETKLVKMDQESEIAIRKDGGMLEVEVRSGSLYFDVSRPPEDDESMTIRSSNMAAGIQGACGWVKLPDKDHMNVYVLEGTVDCTVGDQVVSVTAGEVGRIDGAAGTAAVEPFARTALPGFITPEIDHKGLSLDDIPETVDLPQTQESTNLFAAAVEAYRTVIGQADSYDFEGDAPTGEYLYALVLTNSMNAGDVPTLLLKQNTTSGLNWTRLFWYVNRDSHLYEVIDLLPEGVGHVPSEGTGEFAMYASTSNQHGVIVTYRSSDIDRAFIRRYDILFMGTIPEGQEFPDAGLQYSMPWNGSPSEMDAALAELSHEDIVWYDVSDPAGLDALLAQGEG